MDFSRIRKRNGRLAAFDITKITKAVLAAGKDVGFGDEAWAEHLANTVLERIPKHEIPTVEGVQDIVEDVLIDSGHSKVAKAYILYRKRRADERSARAAIIGHVTDTKLTLSALKLLKARYLRRSPGGTVTEAPDDMFRRVANFVAKADKKYGATDEQITEIADNFFEAMSNVKFLPNSPCLMNADSNNAQLSSSVHIPLHDELTNIFAAMTQGAHVHQCGAGCGLNFSNIRHANASVKSLAGVAAGPIKFLHLFNSAFNVIKQGGRRQGGNMAILNANHPDIINFITAKTSHTALQNFNLSVGCSDNFLRAVVSDDSYDLLSPENKEVVANMNARQVFDIIIATAWRSADPGLLFLDRIEKDNPTPKLGPITGVSPCAEHMIREYEMAFLGSINLSQFVKDEEPDWENLKNTVHLGVHFLDNCIDLNAYPLEKIKEESQKTRKIGLGIMGLAHLLVQCNKAYDSDEGRGLIGEVMKFIRKEADEASKNLAEKRNVFPAWEESVYAQTNLKQKEPRKLRNATRLSISPTGSISIIANTSGGIEPLFSLSYVRRMHDGRELVYLDPHLKQALRKENLDPDVW
ncbi:MAG: adenosylcobalamin-dependent ribonucleoside-diphosphate reductase, partial [Candidatus Nanoarchaeia archaeon]